MRREMSYSYRQPVPGQPSVPVAQVPLTGRMTTSVCSTGSPTVYSVIPNSYGFVTQQQQFIAQPVVYPHSIPNSHNRVPYVTAMQPGVPGMYMPHTPSSAGVSRPTIADPTKLLEEQRRLERERNFQLQQERLKQFTVAGKKGSINADNLIDSMFGKIQPNKISGSTSVPSPEPKVEASKPKVLQTSPEKSPVSLESYKFPPVSNSTVVPAKKDPKDLENMMLACSDLNAPSKASKFSKPSVRETVPTSSPTASSSSFVVESEKARDWRNVQGLNDVFITPKARFPLWCQKEKVTDLFRHIETIVTNNNQHAPDTSLLFPILTSSGLPRELLGKIWELVNESASGQLTVEEMYAALALIAIAQTGYPITSVDILHQLPSCPLPRLNIVSSSANNQAVSGDSANATSMVSDATKAKPDVEPSQFHSSTQHQVIRPTAISLVNTIQVSNNVKEDANFAGNIAEWKPFADSQDPTDDEFDDFKSATPTAINFSMNTPTSTTTALDDDFDDFQQAPSVASKTKTRVPIFEKCHITSGAPKPPAEPTLQEDLMSPQEDKYSVFRSLQETDNSNEWVEFSSAPLPAVQPGLFAVPQDSNITPQVLITESADSVDSHPPNTSTSVNQPQDDEFGDFIQANPTTSTTSFMPEFADFSNFKQAMPELPSPQLDDEFGEFASSTPTTFKPEFAQEFLFRHVKDNTSWAESQSISSLELGTFDGGGGHSGESKSSLSRQGSVPSLELKCAALDGTDSESGFPSPFVTRKTHSPSPSCNTKGSDENDQNSVGLAFQSTLPVIDKYSVIRQEKRNEEDQHVSSWVRCLQSSVTILQNTQKVFNQMSCSSVCNEVISSEEGANYVKNVTEVYKVVCRIRLASKTFGKQTDTIQDLLNEADCAWNTICVFFAGTELMPEESSLDFSSGLLKPEPENNAKSCGLCLLNINLRTKSFKQEECANLSYGGKNYHSPCANFWVNCVDPLLPALTLPQLL